MPDPIDFTAKLARLAVGDPVTWTDEEVECLFRFFVEAADRAKRRRVEEMPDEQAALRALFQAYTRLQELGFKDAQYAPNGAQGEVIEVGSTGIHMAKRDRANHCWWIDDGDTWPSRPILWRPVTDKETKQ